MKGIFGQPPFGERPFLAGHGPKPDKESADLRHITTPEAQRASYDELRASDVGHEEAMRRTGMTDEDFPPQPDPIIQPRPEDQI